MITSATRMPFDKLRVHVSTGPSLANLQVTAYRVQVLAHLLTGSFGITPTKYPQQPPMALNGGLGRFPTAAISVVDGLHLTEAGQGGLQHAVPGCLGDCVVKRERQLVELVGLVDDHFRLINKFLEPVPLLDRGARGGESGQSRLDGALGVEHLLRADIEEVVCHS